jgi:uncharacterized membrane protein
MACGKVTCPFDRSERRKVGRARGRDQTEDMSSAFDSIARDDFLACLAAHALSGPAVAPTLAAASREEIVVANLLGQKAAARISFTGTSDQRALLFDGAQTDLTLTPKGLHVDGKLLARVDPNHGVIRGQDWTILPPRRLAALASETLEVLARPELDDLDDAYGVYQDSDDTPLAVSYGLRLAPVSDLEL